MVPVEPKTPFDADIDDQIMAMNRKLADSELDAFDHPVNPADLDDLMAGPQQ